MNSQLWVTLSEANLVKGDVPNDIEVSSPWYIKILLAFSGWLAAIFIVGFLGALFSRFYNNVPLLTSIGIALIITAFFLLRIKANEFLEHLALALSLAGQVLLVLAITSFFKYDREATVWLLIALVQLPLALFMPNFIHRLFSAFIASIGFAISFYYFQATVAAPTLYGAFLMLVTALIWLNEFSFPKHIEKLQAIGYGLVLALISLKGTNLFMHSNLFGMSYYKQEPKIWFQPWMGEILFSAVTLFVVWKLLQKCHPKPTSLTVIIALVGTLALSLLSTQAQGLIVGIMVILLGFSASNRVLLGLGIIALLFFISSYYYLLENTLLDKSITLFIVGVMLIIARWIIQRLFSNKNHGAGS